MSKYRWIERPIPDPDAVARMQHALNDLPEALARALVLRGIDTFDAARQFFRPALDHLHDPFLMLDMDAAADRVARAIQHGERVLVYGDYDVDGTTATALMTSFLREQGVEADYFIPNRFDHGYGLHTDGLDHAVAQGASLVIALDCGITAIDEAVYAREQGLDLIICDHHTALAETPDAFAVLDPKRPGCEYPFKELSGCGVAFKLAQATLARLGKSPESAHHHLDLVAVSTASDIVPLVGENRVLMREGMDRMARHPRLGLRMLARQANLDLNQLTVNSFVFGLGPRINAAGRLDEASLAVDLMLADDEADAVRLAQQLERANDQRRALDKEIQTQALRKAELQLSGRMRHALVLHDPDWHQGVIGIVASRVVERFNRPAVILCTFNGHAKGSARSIAGVNIYDAIKSCEDLLLQFGGHDYAAGLSLQVDQIDAFRTQLEHAVEAQMTAEMLLPSIEIDAPLHLDTLDRRFWSVLKQFSPFGPKNMHPIFLARGLEIVGPARTVGGGAHLKLRVRPHDSTTGKVHEVIGFGLGDELPALTAAQRDGRPFDLLFCLEENHWKGRTTLQLRAKDLRVAER